MRSQTLLLLALLIAPVASADIYEGFEDMEVFSLPDGGDFTYTTSGTGSFATTNFDSYIGAQSYRVSTSTASQVYADIIPGVELCDADKVEISFNVTASSGTTRIRLDGAGSNFGEMVFQIEPTYLRSRVVNDANSGSDVATLTSGDPRGSWHKVQFREINCAAAKFTAVNMLTGDTVTNDVTGSIASLDSILLETATVSGATIVVDEIRIYGLNPASGTSGEVGSATFDNLQAFDVAGNGNHIIARDAGSNLRVQTLNGFTLASTGTDTNDFCNLGGGVDAMTEHVAFLSCSSMASQVDGFRIRSPSLGDPVVPQGCTTSECQKNWDNTEFNTASFADDIPEELLHIDNLVLYEFDGGSGLSLDDAHSVFLASTTDGRLGGVGAIFNTGGDYFVTDLRQWAPQAPDDVCFTESSEGYALVGGVSQEASTRFYRIQSSVTQNPVGDEELQITTTSYYDNNSPYGAAVAIACNTDRAVIAQGDGSVHVFSLNSASLGVQESWSPLTVSGVETGGLALSGDGRFLTAVTASATVIFDMTTGQQVATSGRPAGVFIDVHMDNCGGNVWVGTKTNITRYNVEDATSAVGCEGGNPVDDPNVVVGGSTGGGTGALFDTSSGTALGVSSTAMGWIFGLLMVVSTTAGFLYIQPKLGLLGAAVGVGVAVGFGMIPAWFIVFLVLIGSSIVVLNYRTSG